MASSLAKETEDSSTMSTSRFYSNRKSRKDKYSGDLEPLARTRSEGEKSEERSLYNGGR